MYLQESVPEYTIYTLLAICPRTAPEAMILCRNTWFPWLYKNLLLNTRFTHSWPDAMILCTQTWFPWICKNLLLNARFIHSWPDAHERSQRLWCSVRKHDSHGFARTCSWMQDLHIRGQMPQNAPGGQDSLYENMISKDLQETVPECKIYAFLDRCPRTAPEAMIPCTKTWFP